jgi:hypothetical protein
MKLALFLAFSLSLSAVLQSYVECGLIGLKQHRHLKAPVDSNLRKQVVIYQGVVKQLVDHNSTSSTPKTFNQVSSNARLYNLNDKKDTSNMDS